MCSSLATTAQTSRDTCLTTRCGDATFGGPFCFPLVHTQTEQLVIHQDRLGTDPIITQTLNGCVPLRHFALKLQGFFRGKKRSLHEGGVRQTIVVQWKGTIAPNSISDDLFIFYDLLPYAINRPPFLNAVFIYRRKT